MQSTTLNFIARQLEPFFPPACAGCDGTTTAHRAFCSICRPLAPELRSPACRRCAMPMEAFEGRRDSTSLCSRCQTKPPAFDGVKALWEYDDAVADAIRRIKYGRDLPALRALCRSAHHWFHDTVDALAGDGPVVPVASHRNSLRERGFHVPSLTLRYLRAADSRRISHRLTKTVDTPRQAGLSFEERYDNTRGVFQDRGPAPASNQAIVFDDVLTTGATADAAANALREAGYETIDVVVLARAPAPRQRHRRRS